MNQFKSGADLFVREFDEMLQCNSLRIEVVEEKLKSVKCCNELARKAAVKCLRGRSV